MIRVVVDGVFFQLNNSGIARVWESILRILVTRGDMEIFLLDRGRAPRIAGITNVAFPDYLAADVVADSHLIQNVCEILQADAFSSTYYTTPLSIPMVLIVHDMIPELFDFDLTHRSWMEKETAIMFATRHLCVSQSTRHDLLKFYPELPPNHVEVAYCGLDTETFSQRSAAEIAVFRQKHGLDRPYFLFVGSRVQHKSYKNSDLFFSALKEMTSVDFDVFCVGGEESVEQAVLDNLPAGVRCRRVVLSDRDLALAYAGAIALVYPSLYEGFGMPVIEAMGSGCPVITTRRGSLAEAAGDAALFIDGTSIPEMSTALTRIQDPALQADLRARGLAHAAKFRWGPMADLLARQLMEVAVEGKTQSMRAFFKEWKRLRAKQADVDFDA